MTPAERLDAIQVRLDAACPRPWTTKKDPHIGGWDLFHDDSFELGYLYDEDDARLIAQSPEDLEALLAVARAAVAYVQHDWQAPTTPNLLPGDLYAALEQAVEAFGDSP